MSKVRDLPEITSLDDQDLLYAVDASEGTNGGRRITKENLKDSVALTPSEVKEKYESNTDTNAFTDVEKAKLAGIEDGAVAEQMANEVPYDNSVSGIAATNVQDAIDSVSLSTQADFRPSIVSGRILHYSGGTARFDDVFYPILAGDILLDPNVSHGEIYVDLDGIVKQTNSGITAPPLSIVIAQFSTDLNVITFLHDERVKNSQNIVRGVITDVRDIRAGAAASAGNSGRISDALHKHNVLTGAPSTQTPDQANAEGVSVNLARADHVHNIPTDAPVANLSPATSNTEGTSTSFARADHIHAIDTSLAADITTINAGDVASAGLVDKFARGDHKHAVSTAIPSAQAPGQANAEGTSTSLARADHAHSIPVAAPTTNLSPATTNAQGVGTSFARNDHTHAVDTGLVGDIVTIQPDATASAGVINRFARADHRHAIDAAAPTTTLSPAVTNAEGVGTSFARNDHTHTIATALVGDITTIQPDDVANAGVANTFARGDHKHAIVASAASTQVPDQANAEGVSNNFARADHVHNIPAGTPSTTLSPAILNSKGGAASFALSDHTHSIATALVTDISTIQPDATASAGVANTFARGDHKHAIDAAAPSTQTPNQTNTEGISSSFARADHIHNIATAAPTSTLAPSSTNTEGITNSFARADHTHAYAVALDADVSAILPNDTAATGTIDKFSRAGHKHAIATAAATSISTSTSNAEGNATSFARSNHTHAVSITNVEVTAIADDTTASLTDVLMNSMISTPAAGTYLAIWSGSVTNSANGTERLWISLYSAGAQVSATERSVGISGGIFMPTSTQAVITVNGSQAIEVRWRAAGGTNTVHNRRLTLVKLA
jgi:hypothetical protein